MGKKLQIALHPQFEKKVPGVLDPNRKKRYKSEETEHELRMTISLILIYNPMFHS
jgi:hypothetical protein